MALVDPNIALSYRGIQLQDPLEQYGRITNIQSAQQAQQMNALQMDEIMRERDALSQIQKAITEKGGPPDLNAAAEAMIKSGRREFMTTGIALRQKLEAQKAFADYQKAFGLGNDAASATSAPSAAAAPSATTALSPFQQNMLENKQNLGFNQLIPPTPTPPVNKLAAPSSIGKRSVQDIRKEYDALSGIDDPRAKSRQQFLLKELDAALKPESNRPLALSPGQILYDPTGKVLVTAPDKPATPTELQRLINERDALPLNDPRRAVYDRAIIKATTHSPGTTIKLPEQERLEQGERGKLLVKQYEDVSNAARIGARSLPALQSNIAILDKGFDTGFGTETKAAGAKVLAALGVTDAEKYATDAQTFLGNASAAVLQRQLEQKGPQTEADAQRITQTGAQLGNTKDANRFLINVAKAQINRDIEQRNFYDKWWKANKTYDGAEDAWYAGEGGKSLFERPELKNVRAAPSLVNQIPTGRAPNQPAVRPPTAPAAAPAAIPIPQAAIDALKAKKGTPEQFDQIFGAGAAKRVLGGK